MAIAAGKSGPEKIPAEELSKEETRFAAATRQRTNRGNVPHADDNRIGPCRVQQQRGSRDHQYQKQRGGSRALDLFIECKSLNPFPGKAGDRCWVPLAPSTLPPLQGSLGKDPIPPSTERPLPQENYHLELTSVKTSFWPPNLDQKSWIRHKTTDWSRSS